jgi:hypothetical protein
MLNIENGLNLSEKEGEIKVPKDIVSKRVLFGEPGYIPGKFENHIEYDDGKDPKPPMTADQNHL